MSDGQLLCLGDGSEGKVAHMTARDSRYNRAPVSSDVNLEKDSHSLYVAPRNNVDICRHEN